MLKIPGRIMSETILPIIPPPMPDRSVPDRSVPDRSVPASSPVPRAIQSKRTSNKNMERHSRVL